MMMPAMNLKKYIKKNLKNKRLMKLRLEKEKNYYYKPQISIKKTKSIFVFLLFLFIFFMFLITQKGSANILINEVMYDPGINDNYYEWIELYNPTNESINLSGWTIADSFENETIENDFDHGNGTMTIPSQGYAVITDHGTKIYEIFSIPNETIKLYIDDSSIGNGLGNSGDKLLLKNETGENITNIKF